MCPDDAPADGSADSPAPEEERGRSTSSGRRGRVRRREARPTPEEGAFLEPPPVEGGGPETPSDEGDAGPEDAGGGGRRGRKRAGKRSGQRRGRRRGRRGKGRRGDGAEGEPAEAGPAAEDADEAEATPAGEARGAGEEGGPTRKRKARGRRSKAPKKPKKPKESKEPKDSREPEDPKEPEEAEETAPSKKRSSRRRVKGARRAGGRERREGRGRSRRDARAIEIVPKPEWSEAGVEKLLLVSARDREEARIALVVDGRLEEVYIEAEKDRSSAGNIHRGRIQNVEPGIGAAFVDLGRGLTGFLHASDVPLREGEESDMAVTDRLHPGDEVLVQITRDGIGRKGPALTGRVSLPGRYLVLMPFTDRSGISRRIAQGPERDRMRKLVKRLELPEGMGVIVRTASETTDLAALEADLAHLLGEWQRIQTRLAEPDQPGVLRGESDIAERAVRDIMPSDVTRIVVDKEETAGRIHQLLRTWYPSAAAAAEMAGHLKARAVAAAAETPLGEIEAARREDDDPAESSDEPSDESSDESSNEPDEAPEAATTEEAPDAGAEAEENVEELGGVAPLDEAETDEAETGDGGTATSDEDELARQTRIARAIPDVEIHTDAMPLFHAYDVETQLEDAFRRSLRLPAGGSIVVDPTEALVAIDVNSGRLTEEKDPESTALVTNLEAVDEGARQLRLRDLGGLVVLDLIDMRERASQRQVEKALREALSRDRARIRLGRMGPFGCVVLSRQRIRQAVTRITHEECPACHGTGRRRHATGLGLRVLHEMEARVARSRGRGGLEVRAPQPVLDWVKKHRGHVLRRLKKTCSGPIVLQTDSRLAADGWAMKGLPPSPKEGAGEEEGG